MVWRTNASLEACSEGAKPELLTRFMLHDCLKEELLNFDPSIVTVQDAENTTSGSEAAEVARKSSRECDASWSSDAAAAEVPLPRMRSARAAPAAQPVQAGLHSSASAAANSSWSAPT